MMPTPQPPVTIPQTGGSMNVTLLFALALCSALPPKRHMNIIFRHATQALPRALWRVFFLHTQICGKNITLRGVFLIDKLPPPGVKLISICTRCISFCPQHKGGITK